MSSEAVKVIIRNNWRRISIEIYSLLKSTIPRELVEGLESNSIICPANHFVKDPYRECGRKQRMALFRTSTMRKRRKPREMAIAGCRCMCRGVRPMRGGEDPGGCTQRRDRVLRR